MTEISSIIRTHRAAWSEGEKPLSLRAFGKVAGVSRQTVLRWESGDTRPDLDTLQKMQRRGGRAGELAKELLEALVAV